MRATGPTARSAHPVIEFRERYFDAMTSRFRFLAGGNPADPLIARKRRNIFPSRSRLWSKHKRLSQIRWQCMHDTGGKLVVGHYGTPTLQLICTGAATCAF
jgi:hypothetical protein